MKKCASSELIINRNKSSEKITIQSPSSNEEQKENDSKLFKKNELVT